MNDLLGKRITVFCVNYIYTGLLECFDGHDLKLIDPQIVYETGALDTKEWENAQKLPSPWYVRRANVESYGILK